MKPEFNLPESPMFNGLRVIESPHAVVSTPVRKHKLTKSQLTHLEKHMFKGITYHDRIQKKWNKRFGFKSVPGCFIVDPSKLGVYGSMHSPNMNDKVIVAHPTVIKALDLYMNKPIKPADKLSVRYEQLHKESIERVIRGNYEFNVSWLQQYERIIRNNQSATVINCTV